MKKNRKIIGITILALIVAYWGMVFFMRDKSPNWCNLSWGTYDVQGSKKAGGLDSTFGGSYIEIYGCQGGVFDLFHPYIDLKNNFNCPDDWIQNRHGEYFSVDGRRVDPSIDYMRWVKEKCNLKPTKFSELGF